MPAIGVMREGPLHAAVKELLAAPGDRFEVPVGRYVIDLVRADGELVEVQTGGFGALGKKLDALLDAHRVRVVHPVAAERRIVRVDAEGEVLSARRSPKRATAVAVFDELVAFPSLLSHPNLTIEVLLLREDHIRGPEPVKRRRRTRDPGSGGWSSCSTASSCARRATSSRRSRRSRPSRSARASSPACSAAARCSRSGRSTACGRSGSSSRRASGAARRCTPASSRAAGAGVPRRSTLSTTITASTPIAAPTSTPDVVGAEHEEGEHGAGEHERAPT